MYYRLTCECGAAHLVTTSQAGQQLECSCGKSLSIPTLRGLQELPHVESSDAAPRRPIDRPDTRRPSVLIGTMFTIIFIAVPVAIFFTYQRVTMDTSYTEASDREQAFAQLDAATPAEISAAWYDFSTQALGPPTKPIFYRVQAVRRGLEWRMAIAWGMALLAMIIAGIALTHRREKRDAPAAT